MNKCDRVFSQVIDHYFKEREDLFNSQSDKAIKEIKAIWEEFKRGKGE